MRAQYIPPGFRDASQCQSCEDRAAMDKAFLDLRQEMSRYQAAWIAWIFSNPQQDTQCHRGLTELLSILEFFREQFGTVVETSRISDAVIFDQYYVAIAFGLGNALTAGVIAHGQYWQQTAVEMDTCQSRFERLQSVEQAFSKWAHEAGFTNLPDFQLLTTAWNAVQDQVAKFRSGLQSWLDERQQATFKVELPK